ncbi:unnamed protein product, partial [Anisakis simplex]|uniref:MAM domain-containing protein n=1 Tax=Anisakis simplex TaxID=6269 RepID=A0A0M3J2Z8_ANISI
DGLVRFRYWTSPGVSVRVCFRRPGAGKRFDWCSAELTTGDPGPALITIPGSILHKFELVIEARNFIFQAFGMAGGLCVLDDISYTAKAVRNCRLEPHQDALIDPSKRSCMAVQCSFDEYGSYPVVEECLRRNIHETPSSTPGTGWHLSASAVGNYHTGIRKPLAGRYAYVHGPGSKVFWLSQFSLPRDAVLEFCYYRAFRNARLAIYNEQASSENRTQLYESDEIDSNPHEWVCDGVRLPKGDYASVYFVAEKLSNEYAYLALDQIGLADPLRAVSMCQSQMTNAATSSHLSSQLLLLKSAKIFPSPTQIRKKPEISSILEI